MITSPQGPGSMHRVQPALEAFLESPTPRVVALSGDWGIGKTHFWRHFIQSRKAKLFDTSRAYSYVSMFGLETIQGVRDAIFEGALSPTNIGNTPNLRSLVDRSTALLDQPSPPTHRKLFSNIAHRWRRTAARVTELPWLSQFDTVVRAATRLDVYRYLICIDDLERHSKQLSLEDILGLLTVLRDEHSCRILVIHNADALDEQDKEVFSILRDKVFDHEFRFQPTPVESASLVLDPTHPLEAYAASLTERLSITNIRVLKRIKGLLDQLLPLVGDVDPLLQRQVVHSSVLLTCCHYGDQRTLPPLSYMKALNYGAFTGLMTDRKPTPLELVWQSLLRDYEYLNTDSLDSLIIECLESGFPDCDGISGVLASQNRRLEAQQRRALFEDAWHIYHSTFDDNESTLVASMKQAVQIGADDISPENIDSTIRLLRNLGRSEDATAVIEQWVAAQAARHPSGVELRKDEFGSQVADTELLEAIDATNQAPMVMPTYLEVIRRVAERNGWSPSDEAVLANASVDDVRAALVQLRGPELNRCVGAALNFGRTANPSAQGRMIAEVATSALREIGLSTRLNALRVKRFGIDV